MNRFQERHVAQQNILAKSVVLLAGATNSEVVAVAAGERARVYGYTIDQHGTGTATVALHFTDGKEICKREMPTGGSVEFNFGKHYVEGGDGEDIQVDLDDQVADNCTVNVLYTIEKD